MRQIKVISLSLIILSTVVLLFSLLIPNHSKVSRAITINKPKAAIKTELAQLPNWKQWHPFLKINNSKVATVNTISDTAIQINNYTFSLISATDSSLQFLAKNPNGETMPSTINLYAVGDSCIVNWYSSVTVNWYPWEKLRTIFYDNIYGPALDSNLVSFKRYMEK